MNVDAYFERIGYDGSRAPSLATLGALTRAHSSAIPFENLDVLLGRPISLEPAALFDKLVTRRRGGYCFEQNGLFLAVLEQLGFEVKPISARVRIDRPREFTPARTHVFLRVELDGESYLTDVGVGALSLTGVLRLNADDPQDTPHERRRITREGHRLFHQVAYGDTWHDVCEFTLEEMPYIDRVIGNWYTSTHPESHFKNRLLVARAADDGVRHTLLNGELKVRDRDGRATVTRIESHAELRAVLAKTFAISLDADDTVPGWPFS